MELPKLDFKINLALLAIAYFPILIKRIYPKLRIRLLKYLRQESKTA